ncbi:MAG TPA: ACT domain-containing protein [Acidimicrobiales bacterium]|nr:ACT domain-containing protein [Acidimicrobiales bacterium]
MTHFAVAAVGADRPGIVAAVTRAFVDHGCNLEDSSMTILRGQFAMMLVVDAPEGVGAPELEQALAAPAAELDLVVTVRPAAEAEPPPPDSSWRVSVHGADRPGIVHGVTSLLAERSVNIVDLSTRVVGAPGNALYTMVLEVTLPPGSDPTGLARDLEAKAAELGITCRLHPSEADIL